MAKKASITTTVKRAIDECGMTRYEIAKRSGVSQAALSRFMSGTTALTTDTLDRLQPILGLSIVVKE